MQDKVICMKNAQKILLDNFEPKLVKKIAQCKLIEVEEGAQLSDIGDDITMIPFVVEGSIKVFRKDLHGGEIPIYDINTGQSCIISINSTFTNEKFPAIGVSKTKAKVVLIPKEKSNKWFDEYKSWRKFIVELYSKRLNELVKTLDITAEQRDRISHQNKKITQSIEYAKRIQEAVLPSENILLNAGCEYFIYFKPRDIVSGDFYWISKEEDQIIIAAADATGHGVPGAFMSMLGIAFLNELKEADSKEELQPNLMLEHLRNKVKSSLKQTGEEGEAKDGMDIALCMYEPESGILQYAGAHNPLYVIRKESGVLVEIKPDRQPIGIHLKERPFTNQNIKLKHGDLFYIFSDGFVDQFGGKRGGKFKYKSFKEMFLTIHDKPLSEQKQIIDKVFEEWKGNLEQVDDVLIIGVRV